MRGTKIRSLMYSKGDGFEAFASATVLVGFLAVSAERAKATSVQLVIWALSLAEAIEAVAALSLLGLASTSTSAIVVIALLLDINGNGERDYFWLYTRTFIC